MNTHELEVVCAVAIVAGMSLFGTAEAYELGSDDRTIIRGVASEAVGTQIDIETPLGDAKELACGDPTSPSCTIGGTAIDGVSLMFTIIGLGGAVSLITAIKGRS